MISKVDIMSGAGVESVGNKQWAKGVVCCGTRVDEDRDRGRTKGKAESLDDGADSLWP